MQTKEAKILSKSFRSSYHSFDSNFSYTGYRSVPGRLLRRYDNAIYMPEAEIDRKSNVENNDCCCTTI